MDKGWITQNMFFLLKTQDAGQWGKTQALETCFLKFFELKSLILRTQCHGQNAAKDVRCQRNG